MTSRTTGIALAFVTACVSGVSIYVNGRALAHFADATVYTTAKNLVAGVLLLLLLLVPGSHGRASVSSITRRRWPALLGVAVIGGSVPFVLFFEGLAGATATQAAFIQKTLVIWVALLAVPLLHERFGWPHALAIGFLLGGQAWLAGSLGHDRLRQGRGDDPRGDAALVGRGRLRQVPAAVDPAERAWRRRAWGSGRSCSCAGSPSRASSAT